MVAAPRQARQITPTSPSPSPEPATGIQPQAQRSENPDLSRLTSDPGAGQSHVNSQDEQTRFHLEAKVRAVVDLLYQLAVCAADVQPGSEHLVGRKVNECTKALAELDDAKTDIRALIPHEVIDMLDAGKNPDIHTRNFISRLVSENQYSYGQHLAMQDYHDQLDHALEQAFPDLAQHNT